MTEIMTAATSATEMEGWQTSGGLVDDAGLGHTTNNHTPNLDWSAVTTEAIMTTTTEQFVLPDDMRYTVTNTISIVLYR